MPPHVPTPSKAPPPQYPPLTPSGRALAIGGRVRNISRDPLSPCVMYWPDNEPLPEPCQIRPIDSALMTVSVVVVLLFARRGLTGKVTVPADHQHGQQGRGREAARRLDLRKVQLP